MKKLAFTCVLFACVSAFSAEALTLQEALDKAKVSNTKIKASKEKIAVAESGQSEARARFMPTVSLTAGVTMIDDPISIDLNQIRSGIIGVHGAEAYQNYYSQAYDAAYALAYDEAYQQAYDATYKQAIAAGLPEEKATAMAEDKGKEIATSKGKEIAESKGKEYGNIAQKETEETLDDKLPSFEKKVQDDIFFNARLSVVWPIFTGFKIKAAYDASKENVQARKAEFDMAANTVLMDVATKYFTLRLAEELTTLREETAKNLTEHLERSKKLEEGGQISKAERLRAEVALAEAQTALDNSRRDQSLARLALASLLKTDTNLTAVTPIAMPEDVHNMEAFKELAKEKHPGLRQIRVERKRSQAAVTAARADYFPTIALFGYKELYTKDLTILEPDWAIGAKLQMDLFKGGDTRAKVNNAKAVERSLAGMEEETLDNIGLLVEKRWRELEYARGQLESLQKTRELADESLRSQTMAYEAGLGTSLDVVDAELALARLKMADLKAHYDAIIAWLGLLEASGEVGDAGNLLKSKSPEK